MMTALFIIAGVVFLYLGGEGLVRGAYRSALRVGVTPLVAGLVVVSCSTSMPELVASVMAQLKGHLGNVALGNIIGSNIANVGLILGVAALVRPIQVGKVMATREMPLMLGALVVMVGLMWFDALGRISGLVMLVLLVGYVLLQVVLGRREHQKPMDPEDEGPGPWLRDIWLVGGGVVALVFGGYCLIEGAVGVARSLGWSERVIGLTIVAIGSSLPELAATIVAAMRGQSDIAIGNVIGSNVFNALMITGVVSVIYPIEFSSSLLLIDAPVMLAFSLILWIFTLMHRIGRTAGATLVVLYLLYLTFGVG